MVTHNEKKDSKQINYSHQSFIVVRLWSKIQNLFLQISELSTSDFQLENVSMEDVFYGENRSESIEDIKKICDANSESKKPPHGLCALADTRKKSN